MCIALHTCSSHASEHFPRCPFCNLTLLCPPTSPFASSLVRVLNFLGMARGLPSGLGIAQVDRLSSFVPFGGRLILQRLTGCPQRTLLCAAQHPSKTAYERIQTPSMLSAVRSRSCGRKLKEICPRGNNKVIIYFLIS